MQVLILGATGRLGQMLQWAWQGQSDLQPLWQTRSVPRGPQATSRRWVVGDPLTPQSDIKQACQAADVVINLLGVTPGPDRDMGLNVDLAAAPFEMGVKAPVMLASSAAVYGAQKGLCREEGSTNPLHPYGQAKLTMEQEFSGCALMGRIGNIAGADQLLGGLEPDRTPVLHQFPDGSTPVRSYISPRGFGDVIARLCHKAEAWPDIMNISAPLPVAMGDLLQAAGQKWTPAPAPDTLPKTVAFDTTRLAKLVDIQAIATTAPDIVSQWQEWQTDTGGAS